MSKPLEQIVPKRIWHNDPHGDIPCYDISTYQKEVRIAYLQLRAERDAYKILHNARNGPYGYASQEQRKEIHDALKLLGLE